jgi:hypothetical protein
MSQLVLFPSRFHWPRNVPRLSGSTVSARGSAKDDKHKGWASRVHINADLSARVVRKLTKWTRRGIENHKKAPVHEVGVLLAYQAEGPRPQPRIMAKPQDDQIVLGPPGWR